MSLINFSGLASGIDTNALIDAITNTTRTQRQGSNNKRISQLTDENSALGDLKTKLTDLQSKVLKFATLSGGLLAKQTTSSNESISTATATNAAANGSYTITTSQLAKAASFSFDDRFSSTDSVINSSINNGAAEASRTVSFTIGTGADQSSVSVVLDNTTTLDQFVSNFNAATTQAVASAVNVGTSSSPSYAIVINGVNQGSAKGEVALSVGSEITTAGSGALDANTLASGGQAENALFSVSGITGTITRSSNAISDVIPGVELDLVSLGSASIKISDDTATSQATLQDFVDSYNDLIQYYSENNLITREENGSEVNNIFGALASTSTDNSIISELRNGIAGALYANGSNVRSLADIGITTQRDGTLKFDTNVFSQAVATDPNGVRSVGQSLGDTIAVTGGTIDQFIRFNGTLDTTVNSNLTQITDLNRRNAEVDAFILQQEASLRATYAALESNISRMQSQQSSLTSALAGLGG